MLDGFPMDSLKKSPRFAGWKGLGRIDEEIGELRLPLGDVKRSGWLIEEALAELMSPFALGDGTGRGAEALEELELAGKLEGLAFPFAF